MIIDEQENVLSLASIKDANNQILYVIEPDEEELRAISDEFVLDIEILEKCFDNFTTRQVFRQSGAELLYLYSPYKLNSYFMMQPIVVILTSKKKIVLANHKDTFLKYVANILSFPLELTFIEKVLDFYMDELDEIKDQIKFLVEKVKINTSENEMILAYQLQISMSQLDNAVGSLNLVVDGMLQKGIIKKDKEYEMTKTQIAHCDHMIQTYMGMLQSAGELIDGLTSKRLNDIMLLLTSITIILSVPMIIGGIWGMNVPVPLQSSSYGFVVLIIINIIACIATYTLLKKKHFL